MTSWELLSHRWFWVLVHSLWQQSLAAIGLWVILRCVAPRSAERRYAVTLGVFAFAALLPVVTWAWISFPRDGRSAAPAESQIARSISASQATGETIAAVEHQQVPGTELSVPVSGPVHSRTWIILLLCWSAGAAIQLVRAARDLSATAALLRGDPARDSELLRHIELARDLLRLRRRFDVLISPGDVGPFVFGLWKPTLVLPAAILTGLQPDQLEAILLHELAHLRRYDDVVNLLQRLLEAIFFFNPAILWMSRVLRREREAACDARAVACSGAPFSLAEALVRVAEALGGRSSPAFASLNFVDGEEPGALLDRVRRIVRPNERPRLRLAWPALIGALIFVGLFSVGLERAAFWSISLAKDWLSPQQRIAAVADVLGEFTPVPQDRDPSRSFRLKGTIKTSDGRPLPEVPATIYSVSRRATGGGTSTGTASHVCMGDHFDVSLTAGECWLMYYTDGYAPAVVGPFRGANGDLKDEIEIVLKTGTPGAVRVVDPKGRPIADASVTSLPDWGIGSITGPASGQKSDSNGIWKSEHLADANYHLTIRVPGFSTFNSPKSIRITSQPTEITLTPSDPISAIVVDGQGNPISGARVGLLAEKRPGSSKSYGGSGDLVATSGDDGTFRLDDVSLDCTYDLLVDAGDEGHALVGPLRVDGKQVRVELQKKLTLVGQLRGDADELAALRKQSFWCLSPLGGDRSVSHGAARIDDEGRFRFDSLFAGRYQLSIGKYVIKGELDDSKFDLVIDLKELKRSERDVEVRFVERGMPVSPGGSIGAQMEILEQGQVVFGGAREILDGVVRLRVRTPNTLNLIPNGCLGYWFNDVSLPIPEGDEPFVAEISVLPAGALKIKVLTSGRREMAKPPVGAGVQFTVPTSIGDEVISIHRNSGAGDEIVLSPVPLDVPCLVSASQDYRRAFSQEFRIEGDAPVRSLTLALPSGIDVAIRVEAPDGKPLSNISCEVHHSPESSERGGSRRLHPGGMTWSSDQLVTDREGRLTLIGMPANENGYTITAKPLRDWQAGKTTIRADGGPTVLTLQPGKVLEGKVVDEKTGQGVPNISLRAMPARTGSVSRLECMAEGPTDSEGNFRFSNLPDEPVKLTPIPARIRSQSEVIPGAKEPVIIEIQVP